MADDDDDDNDDDTNRVDPVTNKNGAQGSAVRIGIRLFMNLYSE